MVVANVILTLINVAGYMWLWGLSIETAAAILLTIALGLAVDYSAHIAHAFMAAEGDDRNERMRRVKCPSSYFFSCGNTYIILFRECLTWDQLCSMGVSPRSWHLFSS